VKRDPNARQVRDDSDTASDTDLEAENETSLPVVEGDQESPEPAVLTPQSSNKAVQESVHSPGELSEATLDHSPQQLDSNNSGIFPLPPPLGFDHIESPGPAFDSPFDTSRTEYGSDFGSQTMTRASTTTSMLSPEVPRGYQFFCHTPLAQPTSGLLYHLPPPPPSASYEGWPQPFQPRCFNHIGYSSGSTSDLQPSSHYSSYDFPTPQDQTMTSQQSQTIAPPQTQHSLPGDEACGSKPSQ
jgi:hypothetical protein